MIDVSKVSRRYGSVVALSDVSFHVEKGTVLGLLGQNGAGKTSLLRILTGYLAPSAGEVRICGFDPLLQAREARRKIGYLPENPPLYDEMTVAEYLSFVSELRGVLPHAIHAHVNEIMELCGLTEMRRRLTGHLSKGYRQRTGFAQALCGNPEVIILDEPTVGLDPKQITDIRKLIRDLGKNHTVLFSSHILSEVQQLCDQVIILERGKLCLDTVLQEKEGAGDISLLCTLGKINGSILSQINQMKKLVSVKELPAQEGQACLQLHFHGIADPEVALFTLMSRLNVPILHLSRANNSLEEIFLNAISG